MTGPESFREQQHNHPIELLNKEMFCQKPEHIHQNPVEAGFVEKPEEHVYSSAKDYYGGKGIVELSFID